MTVVTHPNLDRDVSGSNPVHTKDFKNVFTVPQHVLVLMSLSKENALVIKMCNGHHYTKKKVV